MWVSNRVMRGHPLLVAGLGCLAGIALWYEYVLPSAESETSFLDTGEPTYTEPAAKPKVAEPEALRPRGSDRENLRSGPGGVALNSEQLARKDLEKLEEPQDFGAPVMDPNDPKSWHDNFDASGYEPGPVMDPNDPSTWQDHFDPAGFDPGPYLDPEDPSSWPWPYASEGINSNQGDFFDPNVPDTWHEEFDNTIVDPGPRLDPNDPSAWPQ